MVDYDTAAAAVQDPNADPVILAKIAYENPEFGANVAANPRAYPGLKRWLAQFGDQRARDFLGQTGFATDNPVFTREYDASQAAAVAQWNQTDHFQQSGAQNAVQTDALGMMQTQTPQTQTMEGQGSLMNDLRSVSDVEPEPEQLPVATNLYGFTAELALTTTDQMQIAQIAQYAPELRVCIARNPNTYPALIDWLAQLHDPQIDAALASRGH